MNFNFFGGTKYFLISDLLAPQSLTPPSPRGNLFWLSEGFMNPSESQKRFPLGLGGVRDWGANRSEIKKYFVPPKKLKFKRILPSLNIFFLNAKNETFRRNSFVQSLLTEIILCYCNIMRNINKNYHINVCEHQCFW